MLLVVFAAATGIVSAEESPDAGSTWNTARNITISSGYNYIYGGFTSVPEDVIDWWRDDTVTNKSTMEAFLNANALNHNVTVDTYCGDNASQHMEHLQKGNMYLTLRKMNHPGYSIEVNAFSDDDLDYTVLIYRQRLF